MPLAPAPPAGKFVEYDQYIDEQVEKTRFQVRSIDFTSGVMAQLGAAGVFFLLMALVDHWVVPGGLGFWGRLAALTLLVAGECWFFARRVWPPLVRRVNPVYAAEAIERAGPSLKNSLINFLFLRRQQHPVSPAMLEAIEEQAATRLAKASIDGAVDTSPMVRVGYVLAGALVALALYKVVSPKDPLSTIGRILLPWADIQAPSRVAIRNVEPGDTEASRGQQVSISVEIAGLADGEEPILYYTTDDGQSTNRAVPLARPAGAYRYACQLPPDDGGVQQGANYWIAAGDARTRSFRLNVVAAPTIVVEKIDYSYPAYTGLLSHTVSRQGDVKALEGTRVTLHAVSNGEIRSAHIDLECDGRPDLTMKAEGAAATGTLTLSLKEPRPSSYQLLLTDATGRQNAQPVRYTIEVIPDRAPEIEFIDPPADEAQLPADGTLELELKAEDPDFALTRISLRADRGEKPLLDRALLERPHSGQFLQKVSVPLAELGVQAGDTIEYWAQADDNKHPQANRAQTGRRTLHIAPPLVDPKQQPNDSQKKQNRNPPGDKNAERQPEQGEQQNGEEQNGEREAARGGKREDKNNATKRDGEKDEQSPADSDSPADNNSARQENSTDQDGNQRQQKQPAGNQPGKNDRPQGADGDQRDEPQDDAAGEKRSDAQSENGKQSAEKQDHSEAGGKQAGESQDERQPGAKESGRDQGKNNADKNQDQSDAPHGSSGNAANQSGGQAGQNPDKQGQEGANDDHAPPQGSAADQQRGSKTGEKRNADGRESPDESARSDGSDDGTAIERILKHRQEKGPKPDQEARSADRSGGAGEKPKPSGSKENSSGKQNNSASDAEAKTDEDSGSGTKPGAKQSAQDKRPTDQDPGGAGEKPTADQQKKTDQAEGDPAEKDGQPGDNQGQEGAGEGTDNQGAPAPQEDNRPRDLAPRSQPGASQSKNDNAKSPSNSKHQSDSQGDAEGDRSGGGKAGGGQKSNQPGQGEGGKNTPADEGAGRAEQPGQGETGERGGDGPKAPGKTGSAGKERGDGTQQRTGEGQQGGDQRDNPKPDNARGDSPRQQPASEATDPSKDEPGGKQPGKQAENRDQKNSERGKQSTEGNRPSGEKHSNGEQPPNQNAGDSANRGEGQTQSVHGGGQPHEAPDPARRAAPVNEGADEPNLEYARKATDLALEHLKDQLSKDEPDPDLLAKLGWTREDLERFVRRWESLRNQAKGSSPDAQAAQRELDQSLRSLGLKPRGANLGASTKRDDQSRGLKESRRTQPPPEYLERFKAYTQGTAKGT